MIKRFLLTPIFLLLSASFTQADITTDLQIHWTFDDGSGSTAADASGNGRDGTLVNTPTWVAGQVGTNALAFVAASSQSVTVAGLTPTFTLPATMSAWFKLTTVTTYQSFISVNDDPDNNGFRIGISVSGPTPKVSGTFGNVAEYICTSLVDISTGVWYFMAFTFSGDNGTGKCYLAAAGGSMTSQGGISLGTPDGLTLNTASAATRLGGSDFVDGILDDVRVYSRALTDADVDQLFALGAGAAPAAQVRHRVNQ